MSSPRQLHRLVPIVTFALLVTMAPASGVSLTQAQAAQETGAPAQLPAAIGPAAGAPTPSTSAGGAGSPAADSAQASAIASMVQDAIRTQHLRAVILKVSQGDQVVISQAFGESMNGVPATTDMHFRNGNVAFAYLGTLLMEFVDEHKISLDDPIARWMPTLPEANQVTVKMLANHTSGYPDYETDPAFQTAFYADPFHIWTSPSTPP